MTSMFLHNFDAIVTKDYLESRFGEFETRVDAKVDKCFAQVDLRFERLEGRLNLVFWMQGLTIACVVVPAIHGFLS